MSKTEIWHAETLGKAACAALEKNGFDAHYFATGAEAMTFLESLAKPGMTVGMGGSMTLLALGAGDALAARGAKILDHSAKGLTSEQKMETMRAQLTCDLFLSSSNAITLDGEIFNIDGNGNRVAALTFGPAKTVVVAGYNKIVRNLAEAEARAKLIASPMNNKRLDLPNPCVKTGICMDCKSERRICCVYSVLRKRPFRSDFSVVIVGETLGY
jgi:L-lactate utilization protein LutB